MNGSQTLKHQLAKCFFSVDAALEKEKKREKVHLPAGVLKSMAHTALATCLHSHC
jgi:hypothetical protein